MSIVNLSFFHGRGSYHSSSQRLMSVMRELLTRMSSGSSIMSSPVAKELIESDCAIMCMVLSSTASSSGEIYVFFIVMRPTPVPSF